jgi:internalin A
LLRDKLLAPSALRPLPLLLTLGIVPFNTTQVFHASALQDETFTQWCLNNKSLPKETQTTVQALLTVAGTTDCTSASQVLASSESLMLDGYEISDLRPLASLTHLRSLSWKEIKSAM